MASDGGALGELLLQEDYLSNVLRCLVDEGLHECRRVCRFWKDVCSKLPVQLSNVPQNKLQPMLQYFPRAIAISATLAAAKTDAEDSACTLDAYLLRRFVPWTQLRHLDIWVDGDWDISNAPNTRLKSFMSQLESLKARLFCDAKKASLFWSLLRHATRLKTLAISSTDSVKLSSEPFEALHEIRELECDLDTLLNTQEQFLFPSLRHLERLSVRMDRWMNLAVVLPHISEINSLSIWFYVGDQLHMDWTLLTRFKRLRSLSFSGAPIREDTFVSTLKRLTLLKDLELRTRGPWTQSLALALRHLTALRTLNVTTFSTEPDSRPAIFDFHCNKKLKMLTLTVDAPVNLSMLTGLKVLHVMQSKAGLIDWSRTLPCLSQLQSLAIESESVDLICVDSSSLSQLRHLQRLHLHRVKIDREVFDALAQLDDIKTLMLSKCQGLDRDSLQKINCVSQLQELYIDDTKGLHPCSFIEEGSFPHLRRFQPSTVALTNSEVEVLKKRLPSLRKLGITRQEFY